jgi:hypothetical protein
MQKTILGGVGGVSPTRNAGAIQIVQRDLPYFNSRGNRAWLAVISLAAQ